jgi:hypothetical protein
VIALGETVSGACWLAFTVAVTSAVLVFPCANVMVAVVAAVMPVQPTGSLRLTVTASVELADARDPVAAPAKVAWTGELDMLDPLYVDPPAIATEATETARPPVDGKPVGVPIYDRVSVPVAEPMAELAVLHVNVTVAGETDNWLVACRRPVHSVSASTTRSTPERWNFDFFTSIEGFILVFSKFSAASCRRRPTYSGRCYTYRES